MYICSEKRQNIRGLYTKTLGNERSACSDYNEYVTVERIYVFPPHLLVRSLLSLSMDVLAYLSSEYSVRILKYTKVNLV